MFIVIVMVCIDIILYVWLIYQILTSIHRQKAKMSVRTQQMHKNLTNSLLVQVGREVGCLTVYCFQLLIPVLTGAIPVVIISAFNMLGYKLDSPGRQRVGNGRVGKGFEIGF